MTPTDAVQRLIQAGMTEAAIADKVEAEQSTINRIKHGREPRWGLGQALVLLAQRQKQRRTT
jgi:hypothetical protein